MAQFSLQSSSTVKPTVAPRRGVPLLETPFFGLLEPVTVDGPTLYDFDGSLARQHVLALWTWLCRDAAQDVLERVQDGPELLAAMPELLRRVRAAGSAAQANADARKRLRVQLGGEEVVARLPIMMEALRHCGVFDKAQALGRAMNLASDEAAVGLTLKSMPLHDAQLAAFLMHALVAQVANPAKLLSAAAQQANGATEMALARAGFAPLVDGVIAHAQNVLAAPVWRAGVFADMDLACRLLERYHRLVRALHVNVDLQRHGLWWVATSELTRKISENLEPRLREVGTQVIHALRRTREGPDALDQEGLLTALNSIYLLATVRECRESLALNVVCEEAWTLTGAALEQHVRRNLELFKTNPSDPIAAARLDAGIKMSEIRFGGEFARALRQARDGVMRRQLNGGEPKS